MVDSCKHCAFYNNGCDAPEHIQKAYTYYDTKKKRIVSDLKDKFYENELKKEDVE